LIFVLPFIEEGNIYYRFDVRNANGFSWSSVGVPTYWCPADPSPGGFGKCKGSVSQGSAGRYISNYGMNYYVFGDPTTGCLEGASRIPASFPDGVSNTILYAEKFGSCGSNCTIWSDTNPYYRPGFCLPANGGYTADFRFPPGYPRCPLPQVVTWDGGCDGKNTQALHGNVINVCLADGSVHPINSSISADTWANLCDPRDGNPLGSDW
jgi:prepilin-type processing-associated H-X9-DG protein